MISFMQLLLLQFFKDHNFYWNVCYFGCMNIKSGCMHLSIGFVANTDMFLTYLVVHGFRFDSCVICFRLMSEVNFLATFLSDYYVITTAGCNIYSCALWRASLFEWEIFVIEYGCLIVLSWFSNLLLLVIASVPLNAIQCCVQSFSKLFGELAWQPVI